MSNHPRYRVTVVSIGANGLAQRPTVIDTHDPSRLVEIDGELCKTWRSDQEHLAQAAADRLNDAELDEQLALAEYRREQADWQIQS